MSIRKDLVENIFNLLESTKTVPGHIIELGVYTGTNSIIFGNWIKSTNQNKKYFGFDTFSGHTQEDIAASFSPKGLIENQLSNRWNIDSKTVQKSIDEENLENICFLVEGDIKDTVKSFRKSRGQDFQISVLYIDCNAYLPAITALNELKSFFSNGALIFVDEHTIGGETRALEEFCEKNKLSMQSTGLKYPTGPSSFTKIPSSWNKK